MNLINTNYIGFKEYSSSHIVILIQSLSQLDRCSSERICKSRIIGIMAGYFVKCKVNIFCNSNETGSSGRDKLRIKILNDHKYFNNLINLSDVQFIYSSRKSLGI